MHQLLSQVLLSTQHLLICIMKNLDYYFLFIFVCCIVSFHKKYADFIQFCIPTSDAHIVSSFLLACVYDTAVSYYLVSTKSDVLVTGGMAHSV